MSGIESVETVFALIITVVGLLFGWFDFPGLKEEWKRMRLHINRERKWKKNEGMKRTQYESEVEDWELKTRKMILKILFYSSIIIFDIWYVKQQVIGGDGPLQTLIGYSLIQIYFVAILCSVVIIQSAKLWKKD